MILLADGGSTKICWVVLNQNKIYKKFYTQGLNPISLTENEIQTYLHQSLKTQLTVQETGAIKRVYYYGAGCGLGNNRLKFKKAINAVINQAEIYVDTDIKEAARALCGNQSGIVCVLGTGSNSCCYNGKEIIRQCPSTGYIFGDEGSGYAIGRRLLKMYMEEKLSSDMKTQFEASYHLSFSDLMNQIYALKNPKTYIASFATFVAHHQKNSEMKFIYETELRSFFDQIKYYYASMSFPLYFIGSIAYAFEQQIRDLGTQYGFKIEKIEKEPINGLIAFYINNHTVK